MLLRLPRDVLVHVCLVCGGDDGAWLALTLRLVCRTLAARLAVPGALPSPWPRLLDTVRSTPSPSSSTRSPSEAFSLLVRLVGARRRLSRGLPPTSIVQIDTGDEERIRAIAPLGGDCFLAATWAGTVLVVDATQVVRTLYTSFERVHALAVLGTSGLFVAGGRGPRLLVLGVEDDVLFTLSDERLGARAATNQCYDVAVSDGFVAGVFESRHVAIWPVRSDAVENVRTAQLVDVRFGRPKAIICLEHVRGSTRFLATSGGTLILIAENDDGTFSIAATFDLAQGPVYCMAAERVSATTWHVMVGLLMLESTVLAVTGLDIAPLRMDHLPSCHTAAGGNGTLALGGGGGGGDPVNMGFTLVPRGARYVPGAPDGRLCHVPLEFDAVRIRPTAVGIGDTTLLIGDENGHLLAALF